MFTAAFSALSALLCASALVTQVAAGVRPRATLLTPSQAWVLGHSGVNGTLDRAVGSDGCPVGWDPCSATTCYPLDGSECCSDGNFCPAGYLCQDGGCCPFGEICEGSTGDPITIGGDEPTFTSTHTTSYRTTSTISTLVTFTSTSSFEEIDSTTPQPSGGELDSFPATFATATTSYPFASIGSEPSATGPSSDSGIFPTHTGATGNAPGGAASLARHVGGVTALAGALAVLMSIWIF
ncbi:hypothetical protein C8Q70DRAFT_1057238 [Cubamyces menziesii]|nr:hypothetical protein C8Q70DRAFT_1057238 [Cubamyces menziesii]